MSNTRYSQGLEIKLFTFLLVLYYLLTMLFPHDYSTGSNQTTERIFPQLTMGLIGVFSLFIVASNANKIINSKLCRPYLIYLILGFFYIFYITDKTNIINNFIYFLKLDMAILSLGTFYIFLGRNRKIALRCIYFVYVIQLIYGIETLFIDRIANIQNQAEPFDSNAGFSIITCLPMTMLLPKQKLRTYLYILVVLACIASGQRSAALAAVITIPFTYKFFFKSISKNNRATILILIFILCIPVLYFAITNIMMRNEIDAERGDIGSGRSIFWLLLLMDFIDHNIIQILFGNGYFSPQQLLGQKYGMAIEAHNGWIQNLYVYGIFGLIIYSKTIFIMLRTNKKVNKIKVCAKNTLLICFLVFLVKCTTSHGNWDISVMPFSLVLAIIADDMRRYKKFRNNNLLKVRYNNFKKNII